jgi:hypothetical protein
MTRKAGINGLSTDGLSAISGDRITQVMVISRWVTPSSSAA